MELISEAAAREIKAEIAALAPHADRFSNADYVREHIIAIIDQHTHWHCAAWSEWEEEEVIRCHIVVPHTVHEGPTSSGYLVRWASEKME